MRFALTAPIYRHRRPCVVWHVSPSRFSYYEMLVRHRYARILLFYVAEDDTIGKNGFSVLQHDGFTGVCVQSRRRSIDASWTRELLRSGRFREFDPPNGLFL